MLETVLAEGESSLRLAGDEASRLCEECGCGGVVITLEWFAIVDDDGEGELAMCARCAGSCCADVYSDACWSSRCCWCCVDLEVMGCGCTSGRVVAGAYCVGDTEAWSLPYAG